MNNTLKRTFIRIAPWLGWSLVGMNMLLMGTGLALQVVSEGPLYDVPMPVHFAEVITLSVFGVVGALIVTYHPTHPIGWIWVLTPMFFGFDHFAWGYAYYGYIAQPNSLPLVEAMIVWMYWNGRGSLGVVGITLLLLLFPNGRPLSRRWAALAWIAGIVAVGLILASANSPEPLMFFPFPTDILQVPSGVHMILAQLRFPLQLLLFLCLLGALLSLFLRLKRSTGVVRQQIKWFFYVGSFIVPAFVLLFLGASEQALDSTWVMLLGASLGVTTLMGMSVASAIAIFRYRLWDIDILIRRTLIYLLLSTTMALIYLASVVLLQQIVQTFPGVGSPLVIVISTLITAVLFSPLHRQIQGFIDRKFYRRKYDAEKTLQEFAALAREQIDLNGLTVELDRVLRETVQPEKLTMWLKKH